MRTDSIFPYRTPSLKSRVTTFVVARQRANLVRPETCQKQREWSPSSPQPTQTDMTLFRRHTLDPRQQTIPGDLGIAQSVRGMRRYCRVPARGKVFDRRRWAWPCCLAVFQRHAEPCCSLSCQHGCRPPASFCPRERRRCRCAQPGCASAGLVALGPPWAPAVAHRCCAPPHRPPLAARFSTRRCSEASIVYRRFALALGMQLVAKSDQSTGNSTYASYVLRCSAEGETGSLAPLSSHPVIYGAAWIGIFVPGIDRPHATHKLSSVFPVPPSDCQVTRASLYLHVTVLRGMPEPG